jgi:2'-5' RNA ligase
VISAGADRAGETTYRDHHATIFVPPEQASSLEAVRRDWDPGMAARIAAHVTLVYPQEAPRVDLLVGRLRASVGHARPFRLRVSRTIVHTDGAVHVDVEDLDGGYRALRAEVLRPPFRPVDFTPHVTLIHPRTSRRGREFWGREWRPPSAQEFTTREVALTAFDGVRWTVLETFALGRRERTAASCSA